MDPRAPRVQDAPAVPKSLSAPAGKKPKAKAPLPPADSKCIDASSVDDSAFIMEQKENTIDRDIELLVVLPGDIIKSTTVHGSKPMMDLLIFLCAQYHLNPSSYTIDLLSAENSTIKFKPNTPIGMLEVEKVILKPKLLDKKKPIPIIPEKTVRVVINFKKTQKTIVRVSPHASLQELAPTICSKCEFDPLHTLLLKDYQSQEPLDLTKSLNELGLRELYAMDASRATSVTDFNKSSLQESCQLPQNLDIMKEKENKGFFSFFQRSKKKREQTASAPATPLVSKHRPTFTRSNTISKPYVSNTLPSDAPKKRRAPLPPMSGSQSAPQDLAHIQERPDSYVIKSMSVDETNKNPCGTDLVRTGSLQLSSTSVGNSSLKRTKRKAPSPPSKISLHQSDESIQDSDGFSETNSTEVLSSPDASLGPGLPSHELCPVPKEASQCSGSPETAVASLKSGISSDFSLEEIDEKEELSEVPKDKAENPSLKSQNLPFGSTDISTLNTDPDSVLGSDKEESSQNCEEKQARDTDGQGPCAMVHNANNQEKLPDSIRNLKSLDLKQDNVDENKIIVLTMNTEDMKKGVRRTEITVGDGAKNNGVDVEVDRFSNNEAHKTHTAQNYKENDLAISITPDQKLNQSSIEKTKMQDAAIQTAPPSSNSFDGNNKILNLSNARVEESMQSLNNDKSIQHSSLNSQDFVDTFRRLRNKSSLGVDAEHQFTIKDPVYAHGNGDLTPPVDEIDKNSTAFNMKNYPLYRQDTNPRPKPSNEITRDYIPKIGMTTYKIVPPKSLEMLKDWESESIIHKDDQERHFSRKTHSHQNAEDSTIQSEDAVLSENPKERQSDSKQIPLQKTEPPVHTTDLSPLSPTKNLSKPAPRMIRDTGVIPFAPKLEDINNILESKIKPQISNPQAKPSSFFLQMQKRASGHYVTSAASKSVPSVPNPVPRERTQKEMERSPLSSPEQTHPTLSKTVHSPPPLSPSKSIDNGISSQKPKESSPPPIAPKPAALLSSQFSSLNLKTLKTFGAPRPYSSSAPSPFALAVVKRSQSFSKTPVGPCSDSASSPPPTETPEGKPPPANSCMDSSQLCVTDKENESAYNEQNSQIPSSADCATFPLKRQSSLTFQNSSSDPEQIRLSLLTAIRSGEAAAKLKRVAAPSNTISVNGRSGLSHSTTSDAQDDH